MVPVWVALAFMVLLILALIGWALSIARSMQKSVEYGRQMYDAGIAEGRLQGEREAFKRFDAAVKKALAPSRKKRA